MAASNRASLLCAAWSAAHARQRADDAVLQPRARVVHAGADRSTQCSRACSSLRPCSALRPPPPFDQTSAKVGSQDDWPARVELAVHRRSAPRPTAAQRARHVRTSAFWPQQLRPPLEGPHLRCGWQCERPGSAHRHGARTRGSKRMMSCPTFEQGNLSMRCLRSPESSGRPALALLN